MKTMRKRLIAAICTAVIITMTITPAMAATTTVKGGATRGDATVVSKFNTQYATTLKSSQDYAIFKFKTNSYKTYYDIRVFNDTVSKPFTVYLRGTDKKDVGRTRDIKSIKKGDWTFFDTWNTTLKVNSWYYIIIRNGNKGAGKVSFRINAKKDLEGNAYSDATVMKVGKNWNGKIDYMQDTDYFKFVPTATGKYRVVVKNIDVDAPFEAYLMNGNKSVLGKKDRVYPGKYMRVVKNMEKEKTYYIKVYEPFDEYNPANGAQYKVFIQKK